MNYRIELAPGLDKQLRKVPLQQRLRLVGVIELLGIDPRPPGAKMLRGGHQGLWRVRAGEYRIVYAIDDGVLRILVLRISHRREIYRS